MWKIVAKKRELCSLVKLHKDFISLADVLLVHPYPFQDLKLKLLKGADSEHKHFIFFFFLEQVLFNLSHTGTFRVNFFTSLYLAVVDTNLKYLEKVFRVSLYDAYLLLRCWYHSDACYFLYQIWTEALLFIFLTMFVNKKYTIFALFINAPLVVIFRFLRQIKRKHDFLFFGTFISFFDDAVYELSSLFTLRVINIVLFEIMELNVTLWMADIDKKIV